MFGSLQQAYLYGWRKESEWKVVGDRLEKVGTDQIGPYRPLLGLGFFRDKKSLEGFEMEKGHEMTYI